MSWKHLSSDKAKVQGSWELWDCITLYGPYSGSVNAAGSPHGRGRYEGEGDHAGFAYCGEWQDGRMTGKGCCVYPDGTVYAGEVLDGRRHGQGIYWAKYGLKSYQGGWMEGDPIGDGLILFPNGELYKVRFQDGRSALHLVGDVCWRVRFALSSLGWEEAEKHHRLATLKGSSRPPVAQLEHFGDLKEWSCSAVMPDGAEKKLRFRGLHEVRIGC